jgi:hypothetical protein
MFDVVEGIEGPALEPSKAKDGARVRLVFIVGLAFCLADITRGCVLKRRLQERNERGSEERETTRDDDDDESYSTSGLVSDRGDGPNIDITR